MMNPQLVIKQKRFCTREVFVSSINNNSPTQLIQSFVDKSRLFQSRWLNCEVENRKSLSVVFEQEGIWEMC